MARGVEYTLEQKIEKVKFICEAYKLGHGIVESCKAAKIRFVSLRQWVIKHPEVAEIYNKTIAEMNQNNYDILKSAAKWCLLENVPGLLSRLYIQEIFCGLAMGGYDARWCVLSAAEVGAPGAK